MMRLGALAMTVTLAGCSADKTPEVQLNFCPAKLAKSAAVKALNPIIAKINAPATRDDGCEELDRVLRADGDLDGIIPKPEKCDWGVGDDGPYGQAKAQLEPYGDRLADLCRWREKDGAREFENRGQSVLDGLSPDDRKEVERAYNGM